MKHKKILVTFLLLIGIQGFGSHWNHSPDTITSGYSLFQAKLDSLNSNRLIREIISRQGYNFSGSSQTGKNVPGSMDSAFIRQIGSLPSLISIPFNPKISYFINMLIHENPNASSILLGLAEHYTPLILPVIKNYDLPEEMAFMPAVISGFNLYSGSFNGNTGLWQLSFLNGKLGGLQINSYIDDRKDIFKSTKVAAGFLKELYAIYKDWTLTLVAFNCGPTNVNKAIRRANGKNDFWSIYPFLPVDTRDNIPAYVALNYLKQYHENYGIMPAHMETATPVDTIYLSKPIHFLQVSRKLNIPIDQLKLLNPRYKNDVIPQEKSAEPFCLPLSYTALFKSRMDSIFAYSDSIFKVTRPNDFLINSKNDKKLRKTGSHPVKGESTIYYHVKSGDTLATIAGKYRVSVTELKNWNNLRSNNLKANQKLVIRTSPHSRKK